MTTTMRSLDQVLGLDEPTVTDEHRADVALYGVDAFCDIDRSIALYNRLGRPGGDWRAWEWPRRLAALEDRPEQGALL